MLTDRSNHQSLWLHPEWSLIELTGECDCQNHCDSTRVETHTTSKSIIAVH